MLRHVLAAALLAFATPCLAQTSEPQSIQITPVVPPTPELRAGAPAPRDPFVMQSDACGASRYSHLLEQYTHAVPVSMPENAVIVPRNVARTLEYTPHRLNVAVDETGRIVGIGCY